MLQGKAHYRALALGSLVAGMTAMGMAALAGGPMDPMSQPGVLNIGATSYFDGFGSTERGCTFMQYLRHNSFNSVRDEHGNKEDFVNPEVRITPVVPQLVCNSGITLFGGTLAWSTLAPFADTGASGLAPVSRAAFRGDGAGISDLIFGPAIQFAPVIRDGRPVFSQRIEFSVIAPTGEFNASRDISPGSGFWALDPDWAATWLPAPGWEMSWRWHYVYNFETADIANVPGVTKGQAGQAVHVNFTASREIFDKFYLGLNGYWLKQITDDSATGNSGARSFSGSYSGGKEEALYIGPGFRYTIDPANIISFNVYLPVFDENRPSDGYQVNFYYIHPL